MSFAAFAQHGVGTAVAQETAMVLKAHTATAEGSAPPTLWSWLGTIVGTHGPQPKLAPNPTLLQSHARIAGNREPNSRDSVEPSVPLVLLCTDLQGFTSTVQRLGDARAQTLIRTHNQLLRTCLRRYRGREVTHTGDGILASFRSIEHAIDCSTAMQRKLRAYNKKHQDAPLRARIGLHVGTPLPEENRLFGSCVNITVRVCAAASAERVLVSDAFRQLATEHAQRLVDRGLFALKGIHTRVRLHELVWR